MHREAGSDRVFTNSMDRLVISTGTTPKIPHEPAPTAAQLQDAVSDAVFAALSAVLHDPSHYEMYPSIATYLSAIFPPGRGFQVGPQGILRPVVTINGSDDGDIPASSTGVLHTRRCKSEWRYSFLSPKTT